VPLYRRNPKIAISSQKFFEFYPKIGLTSCFCCVKIVPVPGWKGVTKRVINTNLLRGKIVANGLTQEQIAAQMNMSKNTFSSKINGKSSFSIAEVLQLCKILHITDDKEKCEIFLPDISQ
jgi:DNA-binding XRE family transcriptional regulator